MNNRYFLCNGYVVQAAIGVFLFKWQISVKVAFVFMLLVCITGRLFSLSAKHFKANVEEVA